MPADRESQPIEQFLQADTSSPAKPTMPAPGPSILRYTILSYTAAESDTNCTTALFDQYKADVRTACFLLLCVELGNSVKAITLQTCEARGLQR